MSFCTGAPASIKELLELLVEEDVTIILKSGETECVEVEAVVGNLLVASIEEHREKHHCGDRLKFIDICCICAVIVECEDVLENILRDWKCR